MTDDEVLEDTIWEVARPWEEQWESLNVNESKAMEQELDDQDRQTLRCLIVLLPFHVLTFLEFCPSHGYLDKTLDSYMLPISCIAVLKVD
jgi:hypothetical protein